MDSYLVPQEILYSMKCLNCKKYLYPSVSQCVSCFVSFCPQCTSDKKMCPKCDNSSPSVKIIQLDRLLNQFKVPCRFQGCFTTGNPTKIRRHQEICENKVKTCPLRLYDRCAWVGKTKNQTVKHCRESHREKIYQTSEKLVKIAGFKRRILDFKICDYFVFFDAYNELFRMCFRINYEIGCVSLQVGFHGDFQRKNRFCFEAIFADFQRVDEKIAVKAPCQLFKTQYLEFRKFVNVKYDKLLTYCLDDDLLLKVKIMLD